MTKIADFYNYEYCETISTILLIGEMDTQDDEAGIP